ncbi:MAG: bifunctional oligoribonuclease/PAP phosphatase NrnA [Candidatus Rifleibacteriota bacterium]
MLTQYSDIVPDNVKHDLSRIVQLIKESNKILIASHLRPDGDAVGSVSGLVKSLQKAGKTVEAALYDGIPERFAFVFPEVRLHEKIEKIDCDHDLVIILDAGDDTRTGITFQRSPDKTPLINIDHHASNTNFGALNYVDTGASSTCEMIVSLILSGGFPMDEDVALSLLLGLITDSRSFQNEGIRYTAHLAAAHLLKTGVDSSPILTTLNSGRSEADLRVQGFGLSNFKLECNGLLATLVIKQEDLKRCNAQINNIFASGIFNILTTMKDTLASVVVFEREDGMSFCEFRSRGGIDVKEVAVSMGGGGHVPASGCSKNLPIDQVALEAIEKMKNQVNSFARNKS